MNTACGMPQAPRQASYLYEQQVPSTSYAAPCITPNAMGVHNPNTPYESANPVGYPQMAFPQAELGQPRSSMTMNGPGPYEARQPSDTRKMANTQMWMNEHRFSQVMQQHSRPGSAPSSIISSMTQLSAITGQESLLSINTQMTEAQNLPEKRVATHSSAPSSTSSSVENVDPSYVKEVENLIDSIIENMNTTDKVMQRKIAHTIYNMQLRNHFARASEVKLYKMICPLISLLNRLDTEPDIVGILLRTMSTLILGTRTRDILKQLTMEHPSQMIATFANRLEPNQAYCKYAVITIHSLLEIALKMKYNKEDITNRMLAIMRLMEEHGDRYFINTFKQKQYVFDVLRLVFYKDSAMKSHFAGKGGITMLLNFLRRETVECVAYRNVRVLHSIVSSEDISLGTKFVQCEGIQVVSRIFTLPHCSERLAKQCMWCLRAVSDLPIVQTIDLREAIGQIMFMVDLANTDIDLLNSTVDFLGNVAASKDGVSNINKVRQFR
ncbi:hypothetical protein AB6A40_004673 [Gnathostoma spinigerum]|uniref:Uncharacterized protein n=1 Tax=Gnathostoma spinigerum TaxID=75299 RepID=A0ABD6EII1_9BILA